MIEKNSVSQSVSNALQFAELGFTVHPKPNTVLEALVRTTNDNIVVGAMIVGDNPNKSFIETSDFEAYGDFLEFATKGKEENSEYIRSQHDCILDEVEQDICKAVSNHLSFAKNIVKPLVIEYTEKLIVDLEAYKPKDPASDFDIKVLDLPKPLIDLSFVDTLKMYQDKTAMIPTSYPKTKDISDEDLYKLVLTNDSVVDQSIVSWLSEKTETGFLRNVWRSFFLDAAEDTTKDPLMTFNSVNSSDHFSKADYLLAIFLIANKMFDEVLDNNANISLNDYKLIIADIRNYSGTVLLNTINFIKNYDVLSTLVIKTDEPNKAIYVYGEVYREWVRTGGNLETLFGLIITGDRSTSKASVNSVVEGMQTAFKRYVYISSSNNKAKSLDFFKYAIVRNFNELMQTLTTEEQEFSDTNNNYSGKVTEYLNELVKTVTYKDMEDINNLCLKIICRSRFYYTDAEDILTYINEACEINKGIDIRDAALISAIKYCTNYVADQLMISKDTV